MKILRKLLVFTLILLITTGCSVGIDENNQTVLNESESIKLNLQQADLIADITDNAKYLNKDLLYDVQTLEDGDNISVIISLQSAGLADSYNENNRGYATLSDYSESTYAESAVNKMMIEQAKIAQDLMDKNYINEINHSYTTLINGFSAKTTYGQFKKLAKANLDLKVTISEVYSQPEYQLMSSTDYEAVTNIVNVYETGIFDSSNVDYDGNNTAVAILDSGFDIHHTVFRNLPDQPMITVEEIENILPQSKAYSYAQDIKAQDVFVNNKIPFVYDYADKDADVAPYDTDHGTHVAGIIGGKDDRITGVAINTQLVLMKVFGDINNGAIQEDILAALEDAILLGVDAINLSLGSACGFSRSSDNEYINVVYDKIEAAGISLVVAASNDYSSGFGGENSNTNKASNPDSATVGSPGTYASTIAVASISGVKSKYIIDETGHTFFFNDANNSAGEPYDFYEMLFNKLGIQKDTTQVEYVTVPGVGKKVNYSSIDVEGKIALVKRGDISFEEKAQIALSKGAIGCIIYNNIAGEVNMSAGNKLEIAFCSISKDDGEYLASKGSGKLILDKNYLAGPFMSDFSSWGPVSDLSLKPEITAHGGSILSAVPGGGYEKISGTSMACPNLCGVVILIKQALKERYPEMNASELTNLTNQLLMSTSTIVLDEYGNPYSPRKQGSGLGNLEYALDTKAYLSVAGSTKSKIELKDDPQEKGVYELVFEVNNISSEQLQYKLNNFTMTESLSVADPQYVAEKAYMLNPSTKASVEGDGTLEGDIITIDANGKVTVKYTLTLSEDEKKYLRKSFINGMYVEGFAVLDSLNEDNIDLSIPFLAFFGDWTTAPMFDKTYYEVESEAYDGSIDYEDKLKADYYASTPLGTYYYSYIIPLGSYVYEIDESVYDKIPATEEHAAIGYNIETINGITTVYAGLLRNAKKMTTVIKNAATGEVVYEHVKYDEHKAYFSGSIVPGYDLINITALELGLQNNTKYTFTMVAELDYGDGGASSNLNNTFEFSFYVDYEAPVVTDAQFYYKYDKSLKDYRYYVDVYVYDNHYAQSIRPFTIVDGKLTSLSEYVIPIFSEERGGISKVTLEITDYMNLLQYGLLEDNTYALTNGLGFLVDDYALNQSYVYATLPGTNSSNIAYEKEFYSKYSNGTYQFHKDIYTGDVLDLTYMLTSDDMPEDVEDDVKAKYFSTLKWTSSNEEVIKVKNGVIEAVSAGNAVITCTTMGTDGYVYSINLKIRVRERDVEQSKQKLEDIKFTYFDVLKAFIDGPEMSEIGETGDRFFTTEKQYISFYPGEKVQLGYELEPWNLKDYKLIWSSTNEKVATVDEKGVVTALKEGNTTITLKVEIDGRVSTLMASIRAVVKNEFIIEGNTLVAYKGLGGTVVIPDDEGILYVGPFAFSLYTTDYTIEITEEDYDAAKTPSSNDTVTSVVIPANVKEVQKFAFYNCTALENVTFLEDNDETCHIIREYAFAGDKNLKNINLDNIHIIGERGFSGCTNLVNANIKNVFAIGSQAFKDCSNLNYVDITALRNAGGEVFINCTSLKTISNGRYTNFSEGMFKNSGLTEIDYAADRIPNYCFENCDSLNSVKIINTLVYVGKGAFSDCGALEKVIFNDNAGTQFIYESAFDNCINLNTVILPDSEFEFEKHVFNNCSNLNNITFNKNTKINENIGGIFKGCTNLETFTVNPLNEYYVAKNNLLLSKDEQTIILAAPKYNYGVYTIPSGIQKVYDGAFASISSLEQLIITSDVKEVGKGAFENCINLTKLVLPVTSIYLDERAFNGCEKLSEIENISIIKDFSAYLFSKTALTEVVLHDVTINEGAFSNIDTLQSITTTGNCHIADYSFADCKILATINIDSKELGAYAFYNCDNITNVELPTIVSLSEGVFADCDELASVTFENAEMIGDKAFVDCIKLSKISLGSVKEIGSYAFSVTDDKKSNLLTRVKLPDSLIKIGDYAFYNCINLTNFNVGSGLNVVGIYAFANCTSLYEFNTSGNIAVISEATFAEDYALNTVNINGIKEIQAAAFVNCYELQNINLSTVEIIKMQAFNNCYALKEANMPNVITLEAGAFMQATSLANVNMPKVEYIDAQALSGIAAEVIKLPASIKYIGITAFYGNTKQTKFTDLNDDDTCKINDYLLLDEGVLYTATANGKLLLSAYPTAKPATTYEVIFGTVRVAEYAGSYNGKIEKLIFPDTLELIGNMCFYGCNKLKAIEFKSTIAPTLEGTVSAIDIEYSADSEIYQFLNKYFQFNGYYPMYYGQFVNMIGLATKLNIIVPANAEMKSYESEIYKLYFNDKEVSDYDALNELSIDYLDKVLLIPDNVSLSDEKIIKDARTAYNVLNQHDLTVYGYEQEYLDGLYAKLVQAEKEWNELNNTRINKVYKYLIEDIKALGAHYDFNKIADYYAINEALNIIDRDDKKYIDTTNVESFKKEFDKYFKDLNDDINIITNVSTLSTSTVNKVGLAVIASVSGVSAGLTLLGIFLKKRFF